MSEVELGQILAGRYRVERVLGRGGMGLVVAAQHLQLGQLVAIKLLLPEAAQVPEIVARFHREVRAALRLQSEHVGRVMDLGALPSGQPFMVMELLQGRDLARELEANGPLGVQAAVDTVLEAAAGVAEAHASGIVHRDIKPSNLFRARLASGRTVVKVLDFGIAKSLDDTASGAALTHTFSALGSAAYMSPEQVRAARAVDARSDVWALAVVLFELVTGSLPFHGESLTAIAAAITADDPIPLRELRPEAPEGLERAITGALAKRPAERTPSVAVLAQQLVPFAGRAGRRAAELVFDSLGSVEEGAVEAREAAGVDEVASRAGRSPSDAIALHPDAVVAPAVAPLPEGSSPRASAPAIPQVRTLVLSDSEASRRASAPALSAPPPREVAVPAPQPPRPPPLVATVAATVRDWTAASREALSAALREWVPRMRAVVSAATRSSASTIREAVSATRRDWATTIRPAMSRRGPAVAIVGGAAAAGVFMVVLAAVVVRARDQRENAKPPPSALAESDAGPGRSTPDARSGSVGAGAAPTADASLDTGTPDGRESDDGGPKPPGKDGGPKRDGGGPGPKPVRGAPGKSPPVPSTRMLGGGGRGQR